MKETFAHELWYYYHEVALKLLSAIIMICIAPILSYMGFYVVTITMLVIATFLFLSCLLKQSKEIGMYKGIIFYVVVMGVFIWCFSNIYSEYGITNNKGIAVYDAPSVIYFSVVTWTTLGYGDFRPTDCARLWASIEALIGYVFTGILVGLIISAFTPVHGRFTPKRPAKRHNE